MEHLLLLCRFFEQKNTVLLSTLQRNASTAFYSQQCMQEGKVTELQTQLSSQKQ